MTNKKISVAWSGGKDSSLMLWKLLSQKKYEIIELHTAINSESHRVGLHGVHKELIEAQAKSIGLPIYFMEIEASSTNDKYEEATRAYYQTLKTRGIDHVAFGDIFLEDLKQYRDDLLSEFNLTGIYPLWKQSTQVLAEEFISLGFKSVICASDASRFPNVLAGNDFTKELVNNLPETVDPCGENGEFHSFVFDGPIFKSPLSIRKEAIKEKAYKFKDSNDNELTPVFHFCDLKLS